MCMFEIPHIGDLFEANMFISCPIPSWWTN